MEPRSVRIFLLGDTGVGKTSLVKCLIYESFQPMVPDTINPVTEQLNQIETEIIDTDSRDLEGMEARLKELKTADSCVICVVCAQGWSDSIDSVKQKWLKFATENAPSMPIMIICNNKGEPNTEEMESNEWEEEFKGIDTIYKQVEFVVSCDGKDSDSVREVFDTAQRLALFPGCKLLDLIVGGSPPTVMKPEVSAALRHIFRRADVDGDGHLSEKELNDLHKACFTEGELQESAMASLKTIVQKHAPEGLTSKGFNWVGFEFIWKQMLSKGRFETFWVILRHCGFDDDLKLANENIPPPACSESQELVLSDAAIQFLTQLFTNEAASRSDTAGTTRASTDTSATSSGAGFSTTTTTASASTPTISSSSSISSSDSRSSLSRDAVIQLLSLAPSRLSPFNLDDPKAIESAFNCVPLADVSTQRLSLDGWLAFWQLFVHEYPTKLSRMMPYLGFGFPPILASPTSSSSSSRNPSASSPLRAVSKAFSPHFIVHVLGLAGSGCSQLIRGLINHPFAHVISPSQPLSRGAVSIATAAAAFKLAHPTPGHISTSTSSGTPSKPSPKVPSSDTTTKKGTTATTKSTSKTSTSSTKSDPPSKTLSWLPKADLNYQRSISWFQGFLILFEQDLETYQLGDREADIVLVVFDVSDLDAFDRISGYLRIFKETYPHILVQLVGTKSDLEDVASGRANTLASELHMSPPIIVSALKGNYSNLVPSIHQAMVQHRMPKWTASSTGWMRLAWKYAGRPFFSWLPTIALVAGIAATVWVGLAYSGVLLPDIKGGAIRLYRQWKISIAEMTLGWYIAARKQHLIDVSDEPYPEPLESIIHRPVPAVTPILPGSEQRISLQR